MGMICNLRQVTDEEISQLLEKPDDIYFFLYGEEPSVSPGFFRRIFGKVQRWWGKPVDESNLEQYFQSLGYRVKRFDPLPIQEKESETEECLPSEFGEETDLDKAWHGIHYLLTGSAWGGREPFSFLLNGSAEIGNVDVGYGPARALTSEQTLNFFNAISTLGDDELRSRFNPTDMIKKDIYPDIWERDPKDDDTFGYLMEYYGILKEFLQDAVEKKKGLIVWLS